MIERMCVVVLAGALLAVGAGEAAAGPAIAWSAEFDKAGDYGGAKVLFQPGSSGEKEQDVVINEIKDGSLVIGLKPSKAQRVNLLYGTNRWWKGQETEWGPYDLKDYPVIEIKFRSEFGRPLVYWDITDASGEGGAFYTAATYQKFIDIEDERGKWKIVNYRISPDSSVPTKYTMRKLNGINFAVEGRSKEMLFEIDYIRLRGLNAEEQAEEKEKIELLSNWPEREYPQFKEFFPYGTFGAPVFRWYGGGVEGAYGLMSRYHINSTWTTDLVRRKLDFAHQGKDLDENLETAIANWIEHKNRNLAACKATGLREVIKFHGPLLGVYKKFGMEAARRFVRKVVDCYRDEDAIFAYELADEPFRTDVWPFAGLQRIIEEADPTRPVVCCICTTSSAKGFASYQRINFWDKYAIYSNNRDPWRVGTFIDELKQISDAPQWGLISAFSTISLDGFYEGVMLEQSEGETRIVEENVGVVMSSAAEARLMAYLSLARGVKGLGWFTLGSQTFLTPIDFFGTPEPLMNEIGRIGWRCVTVGRRMLVSDEAENTDIQISTVRPGKEHNLTVRAHVNRKDAVTYLFVVNEDVKESRQGRIALPKPQAVADLFSLNVLGESLEDFEVDLLAPGDARVYGLADKLDTIERENAIISGACADEILRAMKPDLSIARRWKADLEEVDVLCEEAGEAASSSDGTEALVLAKQAEAALAFAMDNHSMLASTRNTLEEARGFLSQAQHMIWGKGLKQGRTQPTGLPKATAHLHPGFLRLSYDFNRCMTDYIAGKPEGLSARAEKVRMSAREHLLMATAAMRKAID